MVNDWTHLRVRKGFYGRSPNEPIAKYVPAEKSVVQLPLQLCCSALNRIHCHDDDYLCQANSWTKQNKEIKTSSLLTQKITNSNHVGMHSRDKPNLLYFDCLKMSCMVLIQNFSILAPETFIRSAAVIFDTFNVLKAILQTITGGKIEF